MTNLAKTHDVQAAYHELDLVNVRRKYHDAGTKYAFDVLDGNIMAGYHIQLAALRHVRDLSRVDDNYHWHYDVEEVKRILMFASVCPEIKTRKPVQLMPWQQFILSQLIGWRDNQNQKRFTMAIVSVARHNGKTYLMAIVMLYSYLIESLQTNGQEFLASSINYKQTSKLFGYIKQMLSYLREVPPFGPLIDESGINKKTLASQSDLVVMPTSQNKLMGITYESGQYDSFHFRTAVLDEAGDPKVRNDTKISKITSGQVDVDNKQFIQISTAYPNAMVPFHLDEKRVLNAIETNDSHTDRYLVLDWSQDNDKEMYQPQTWEKSNPLLGMADRHDKLLLDLEDQKDQAVLKAAVPNFLNKTMNIWTQQSADSFLSLREIESAVIPKFNIKGRQVYIGLDYSISNDNTALAFVYPYEESGKHKWHIKQHSFIPWHAAGSIEAKEKQDGINYRDLARRGFCTITAHHDGLIDADQVYNWLLDYLEANNLQVIALDYDPRSMTGMMKALDENTDMALEALKQTWWYLSDPTKFLQRIFIEHSVSRLDDPIMEKALLNAQTSANGQGGFVVDKSSATLKIDVVDAIVDALYNGMYHFEQFGIANDKSKQVDHMTEQNVLDWFNNPESGLLGD